MANENLSNVRQADSSESTSVVVNSFIDNGSFESGTFDNWRTIGDSSIETKEIQIAPTDGESQALITTGFSDTGGSVEESDLSEFLDLPSGSLDGLLGGNATEGSGIKQTFFAEAGDILEFDYTLLTNEATPDGLYNDSAFLSVGNFVLELADTFDPTFSEQSVEGFSEATETQTLKIAISQAGEYDLGFGIVDLTDSIVDSGLLIDDVKLISTGVSLSTLQTDNSITPDVDFTFGGDGFQAVESSEQ